MTIKVNGKTIDLPEGLTAKIREIIEEAEAEEKQPEPEKKSPFKRARYDEPYFYISCMGLVEYDREYNAFDKEETNGM